MSLSLDVNGLIRPIYIQQQRSICDIAVTSLWNQFHGFWYVLLHLTEVMPRRCHSQMALQPIWEWSCSNIADTDASLDVNGLLFLLLPCLLKCKNCTYIELIFLFEWKLTLYGALRGETIGHKNDDVVYSTSVSSVGGEELVSGQAKSASCVCASSLKTQKNPYGSLI